MANENAVFLSSPIAELERDISGVSSVDVLAHWCDALGRKVREVSPGRSDRGGLAPARRAVARMLSEEFARFRDSTLQNREIIQILEKGSATARQRVRSTLVEVKRSLGVPGF